MHERTCVELDRNPGPVAASIEERVLEDFMNMIRTAMTYSSEQINEKYPLDIEDPIKQAGNKIIIDKYNLVETNIPYPWKPSNGR